MHCHRINLVFCVCCIFVVYLANLCSIQPHETLTWMLKPVNDLHALTFYGILMKCLLLGKTLNLEMLHLGDVFSVRIFANRATVQLFNHFYLLAGAFYYGIINFRFAYCSYLAVDD